MIPFNSISSIRAAMAEECTESSVATSSSIPNWWPDNHLHATSLTSWSNNTSNINPWNNRPQNPNSNNSRSSGEEDVSMSTSFTNASNHSGLTVESSRRLVETVANNELIGETPSDNPLWNHVFLNVGSNGELHNNQDIGDNLINAFSSKNLSTGLMFEPCDYLKKMDNGWENSTPFNNFEQKNFNGSFNDNIFEAERLSKLSNLVSNWSIAPPDPEINGPAQFDPRSCNISLNHPNLDQYSESGDVCYMKPNVNRELGSYSTHGHDHDLKVELNHQRDDHAEVNGNHLFPRAYNGTRMEYQMGMNNSMGGDNNKLYYGVQDVSCNNGRITEEIHAFSNFFSNKLPPMNNIINPSKPMLKTLNLSDCKKQTQQTSYTPSSNNTLARSNRKGHMLANEGKKKRSEGKSDTVLKKLKHESSTASSIKVQVPKAKLGDKITALQQIVSPFGKTDTASVLWEAIGYIKFMQEQVQLSISNPYMKTSNNIKDPWGGLDRKDRGDHVKLSLSSRGLCLIPISCTPQVYRENTGPDYLTPAYRGCLYR